MRKEYCLTNKDKSFFEKEITDSINDTAFFPGDTVVVCKSCNAIMHKDCWVENGSLCGICEGRELRNIDHKFIEAYAPVKTRRSAYKKAPAKADRSAGNVPSSGQAHLKLDAKYIKTFFIVLLALIAVICIACYAAATGGNQPLQDSEDENVIQISETTTQEPTIAVKTLTVTQPESKELTIDPAFVGEDIYVDEESAKRFSGYVSESRQTNEYTFTTPRSGRYNFALEDMMATASARMRVYDSKDNRVIDTYDDSAYADLSGNATYRIVITHADGESSFNLVIGQQKKTIDISNSSAIYDQVSYANQKNVYTFTPQISGRYRFDITEANANLDFRFMMWNDKEENLVNTYEDGSYQVLEAGQTYEIQIRQYDGIGSYCLKVGFQKPETDITGYTVINDSIEYTDQKNVYFLTAPVSGRYRLDITETNANNTYRLMAWDHLENNILNTYESGVYLDLNKGETYEIQVRYYEGFDKYTLNIGYPKEEQDISGYERVYDAVNYVNQINYYKYVPTQTGAYTFSLSEYDSGCDFRLIILDEYDYELTDTFSGAATVDLIADKEYTVIIYQDTGVGSYMLSIE